MSVPLPRALSSVGLRAIVLALVVGLVAAACTGGDSTDDRGGGRHDPATPTAVRLTALSTRAEYVTDGDVLIGLDSPTGRSLDGVQVHLDGRDVTSAFAPDDRPWRLAGSPSRLLGLVSGLPEGTSTLTAQLGSATADLEVVNHPVDGPLFSGPHQSPFACTTAESGLGPAGDDCWAQGRVRWLYRSTAGSLRALVDPGALPPDVATTRIDGRDLPFVIRIEDGVFNRSITSFATLDPFPGAPADTDEGSTAVRAWDASGWNGRLVHRFGGGCGASFSQGEPGADAVDLGLLADGYALITSTLTTFQTACNDVVAAETVMVTKEHFAENYGLPVHTIGLGGSGGAIQQLLIAQNYPGLLDAIAPSIPFPDAVSIAGGVADCGLLGRFYGEPTSGPALVATLLAGGAGGSNGTGGVLTADLNAPGAAWPAEARLAVTGFASPLTCALWRLTYLENLDPTVGCATELAQAGQVYSPSNPRGARCTMQDSNVNLLGTDPDTGYAQRPLDNVGVQYGLAALNAGTLTVDQFLDLNEGIGGYDLDGVWQPDRTRAPDDVLERSYRGGRITAGTATADAGAASAEGAGGLVDVPVLLIGSYSDTFGDIHDRQRLTALHDRLRLPDGADNPNVALWSFAGPADLVSLLGAAMGDGGHRVEAVRVLDAWLTAAGPLDATPGAAAGAAVELGARAAALAAARPDNATDRCVLADGTILTGPDVHAPDSECERAYPTASDPRRVAGAPLVNTVVACALEPADPASNAYAVSFTPEQADRLRAVFADGVCDWSSPGRGQHPLDGTWLRY